MAATFDPYHKWLGIPPAEQPPNYYRLLAINPFESDPDVIEAAADQRMVHLRSLQTGQHAALTQKLLNQISAAKVCLLRPEKKKEYDERLRAKLAQAAPPPAPPAAPSGAPPQPSPEHDADRASVPAASAATGPLDFIDSPAPAVKSGVWEPEPLPVSRRGSSYKSKSSLAGYSSRKTKKPQTPIFGIVAAVAVVCIGLVVYVIANQNSGGDDPNSNSAASRIERHTSEPAKPKPPPHPLPPKPTPPSNPSETHPPASSGPEVTPTNVVPTPPVRPKPAPEKPPEPKPHIQPAEPKLPPTPVETRKPVPDPAAQAKALAQVRDVLKDEYAKAIRPEARADLVRKLIELAPETKNDDSQRYVMGTQAMEMAIKANDADLALQAIDGLDSYFAVDGWELKAHALIQLSHLAKTLQARQSVATRALALTSSALDADHYDAAVEFAAVASTMADSIGEPLLRDQAHDARSKAQRMQNVAQDFKAAKEKLAAHPDDADANLTVGRFLCFQKADWKTGLPFLSRGSDESLKKLARMEAAAPPESADPATATAGREKLADAWWDAAEKVGDKKSPVVIGMLARAKYWYQQAIPGLSGLELVNAQKRSSQEATAEMGAVKLVYLDDLPEQDVSVGVGSLGKHGSTGLPGDQSQEVVFQGVKAKHALAMQPPGNGASSVSYTIDKRFHNFAAVVGLLDGSKPEGKVTFELRGDNVLRWQSRPIGAGQSQECNQPVGNFKTLQLIVRCSGSAEGCHAVWIDPLVKK